MSADQKPQTSNTTLDCHCWAPVTPDGGIIPWLCRTDPQEIERELRFLKRNDWTVKRVMITADE